MKELKKKEKKINDSEVALGADIQVNDELKPKKEKIKKIKKRKNKK